MSAATWGSATLTTVALRKVTVEPSTIAPTTDRPWLEASRMSLVVGVSWFRRAGFN